jgi:hypothetical protein
MNPKARAKATSALEARRQRALSSIDQHTAGARRTYLNDASSARVASTINDAIYDPKMVAQSIFTITEEIEDTAAREGWAPEVTELKVREAKTEIHSGIIGRLETANPIAALEYLFLHKDAMDAGEVARLEGALVPAAKRAQGRAAGAAAAEGHIQVAGVQDAGAGFTTLQLADGQVVRRDGTRAWRNNNPGNIEFGDFAKSKGAVGSDGRFAVFPTYEAGRAAKSALLFESSSYRSLSLAAAISRYAPSNENDTDAYIREVAAAVGVEPFTPMSSLSKGQRTAMLDAMERVEGFKAGSETGGSSIVDQGIDRLLEIEDPTERDAALNEYNLRTGVRKAQGQAQTEAAMNEAFQFIESGGQIDSLPMEFRQNIGMEAMSSLRTYQTKLASGEKVQTDDQFYVSLTDQLASNPEQFVESDPMVWRDKLNDQDFDFFIKKWGEMRSGNTPLRPMPSITAVRSMSSRALEASGVEDPAQVDAFETTMMRWALENPGEAANPVAMKEKIDLLLTPIFINPQGLKRSGRNFLWDSGKIDGPLLSVDFDGDPLDPDDDLDVEDILGGRMKIAGKTVSDQHVQIAAVNLTDILGREPSVSEIVEYLARVGNYGG